jgi:hypothetical protein
MSATGLVAVKESKIEIRRAGLMHILFGLVRGRYLLVIFNL